MLAVEVSVKPAIHNIDLNAVGAPTNGSLSEMARELAATNMEIARKLSWKLLRSWQIHLPEDEVESIANLALCEAARNYDGRETTQFQTFLYYHVRGRLLREISSQVQHSKMTNYFDDDVTGEMNGQADFADITLSLMQDQARSPEQVLVEREQDELFEGAFSNLDWLEKEVIVGHYFDGKSLNDLANSLKYCRCHLSRVKGRAIAKLKKGMNVASAVVVQKKAVEHKILVSGDYRGGRGRRKNGNTPRIAPKKSATLKELCLYGGEAIAARA